MGSIMNSTIYQGMCMIYFKKKKYEPTLFPKGKWGANLRVYLWKCKISINKKNFNPILKKKNCVFISKN